MHSMNTMWREFKCTVKWYSWIIHGKENRYAAFWHIVKDPKTYSALENHICWKEPSEASILPPIHTLQQSWRIAHIRYTSLNTNTSSTKSTSFESTLSRVLHLNRRSMALPLARTFTRAACGASCTPKARILDHHVSKDQACWKGEYLWLSLNLMN